MGFLKIRISRGVKNRVNCLLIKPLKALSAYHSALNTIVKLSSSQELLLSVEGPGRCGSLHFSGAARGDKAGCSRASSGLVDEYI